MPNTHILKVITDLCWTRLIHLPCKLACFIAIWMYSAYVFIRRLHPLTRKWTLRASCWSNVLKTEYTHLMCHLPRWARYPPAPLAPALSVVKCTLHLLCCVQAKSISRPPKKSTQLIEQRRKGRLTSWSHGARGVVESGGTTQISNVK